MRTLVIFIGAMLAGFSAFAAEINVCPACPLKTIQSAVERARDGDRITIKKGTYHVQDLLIEKAIYITGEPGVVVDGGGKTIFYIHHDSVTVSDMELRNVATNYVEDRAALKCNNSDYLIIRNIKVRQSFFGILVEKSEHGIIERCDIRGQASKETYLESSNGNAIHLWYCKDMRIIDNTVHNHRDGIYFEFVENSLISGNWSEGNMRYGLHFMFSHRNHYDANTFFRNGAGVAVMYSTRVKMTANQFVDNWGESSYGLLLKDITDSELSGNIFRNNTIAISADNTSRVQVLHNKFDHNGYAMRIMGNCADNTIQKNDFLQNSFDITTNARINYNDFTGNYWEEYNGYDLDRNGVGDVPFRPVKLFTYIIAQSPASIILMRSTFIDLLNLAEKVTPVLTPESLVDNKPSMQPINDHLIVRI